MLYESNVLAHHGIIGQKWGVRRYQNKDGSLTAEGKRHMANVQKDARKLAETHARLEDMNRELTRGVKPGSQILVPTETKQKFTKLLNEYENLNEMFSKKYASVQSLPITEKGQDYIETILEDKETGWGAQVKIKLYEKSN